MRFYNAIRARYPDAIFDTVADDDGNITITRWRHPTTPQPDDAEIRDLLAAYDRQNREREAHMAAINAMRQSLAGELQGRLAQAPGKQFTTLTDRELLHIVIGVLFPQFVNTGILDAVGIVQRLEQWRV